MSRKRRNVRGQSTLLLIWGGVMMTRICGNCTACCRPLPILESGKPIGVWCKHCDKGVGCRIYESRPDSCRGFFCQWLMGVGADESRPDKTRVILDFVRTEDGLPGGVLQIWEVSEGRLGSQYVRDVTNTSVLSGIWVSHIPLRGRKRMFVPPDQKVTPEIRAALLAENFDIVRVREAQPSDM